MHTASTFGTSISSTPPSTIQPRSRERIDEGSSTCSSAWYIVMTSKLAGRKRGVLNEAGRDRHAKHFARVARVLLIGFEPGRVEAERAQHVHHFSAAGARIENAVAALQIRCAATDSDSARPARTARYGAATASLAPCSRAGIRSSNSGAPPLRPAAGSTRRARTCGRSSSAADGRRDRECRALRRRSSRRDCRGSGTQSRLETSTNCGSSEPSRKFLGFRSNIGWRAST